MANPEHLNILKQGVKAWNTWREKNRSVFPDLSRANLEGAHLEKANLRFANLTGVTDLTQPQLNQACVDETTKLPKGLT